MKTLEETRKYINDLRLDLSDLDKKEILEFLVELGRDLETYPENLRTEERKVPGCVSGVYVYIKKEKDKIFLKGESNSLIVRGYITILIRALNGLSVFQIVQAKDDIEEFVKSTGLNVSMVASRASAFGNILKFIVEKIKN